MEVSFSVPGPPQGKARARTYYSSNLGRSISHTPDNTVLYENLIKTCYQNEVKTMFDNVPLKVCITAYFQPAKSTSKNQLSKMLQGEIFPTKKPDADNIAKVVLDALNGIAYPDDKQVVELVVRKRFEEFPRVEIGIKKIKE